MSGTTMNHWNWLNPYWPDEQWSTLSVFDQKLSIFVLILVLIAIVALIFIEYKQQDCIPGKVCHKRVELPECLLRKHPPQDGAPFGRHGLPKQSHGVPETLDINATREEIREYIDKIEEMVQNNYRYNIWRLSLLSGLIATIPVVYFLKGRIPILIEWIVIGTLISLATYLAFSWLWAHFFYPNSQQMEHHLHNLKKSL